MTWPVVPVVAFALLGWFGALFLTFLVSQGVYARRPARESPRFIIVLGAGLKHGEVSPLLARRVALAVRLWNCERAAGNEIPVVMSGGQGYDEPRPEAEAMAEHGIGLGLPEEFIAIESRSTTTRENLRFSAEVLAADPAWDSGIPGLAVTSNFHALRAALIARDLGLDVRVEGSFTSLDYLPWAEFREFAALVTRFWLLAFGGAAVVAVLAGLSTIAAGAAA
ncbi:MAG TPA: YdcF family protein [Actinomycetaceae bacterium]|nr:YdcF family protein [Actinomycetaceae bacterium]